MNKLYFGDNLEILRELDDQRVHLICTGSPFNSGRDYNAFIGGSLAQKKAFTDTWTWDTASTPSSAYRMHGASVPPRNQNAISLTYRCNSSENN